jgi:hypothetical protein
MAEFFDEFRALDEIQSKIEASVRAASVYVKASDDLRPRVLENARMERRESRAQRIVRQIALCVVVLAMTTSDWHAPAGGAVSGRHWALLAASSDGLFSPTQSSAVSGGDVAWQLVESMTELRRRQAAAFQQTP